MTKNIRRLFKGVAWTLTAVLLVNLAEPAGMGRVHAEEITIDGFTIQDGTLISYTGEDTVVRVPDEVTTIGPNVFSNNKTITTLYLGENVTTIEYQQGMTALNTLVLQNGEADMEVAGSSFGYCDALTTLEVEADVVTIPSVLYNVGTLQEINVAEGNTHYYSEDGVLFVRENSTSKLTLVRFPKSSPITDYVIPGDKYIKAIGEYAFYYCQNLVSVEIPEGLEVIREDAFNGCNNLKTITMGPDVKELQSYAFSYCKNLETLTLSPVLEDVLTGSGLLSGSGLKTLIVPQATSYLPEAMYQHNTLENIQVAEGNPLYKSVDGVLFSADGKVLVSYPRGRKDTSYTVVEGTVEIGKEAFYYRESLEEIILPQSLEVLGDSAMEGATALKELVLPAGVHTLEYDSLYNCKSMTTLTLAENLSEGSENGNMLGSSNALTTIIIPAGAQFVPENFAQHDSVKEFVVEEGNSKYFSQDGVLYGYDEEGRQILISYPKAKEDTTYTVLEGTVEIGHNAFYYRENLEEIILPESLEILGDSSLEGATALKELVLPAGVHTLEYDSLYNCKSMTTLTLAENLSEGSVNGNMLGASGALTTIIIPAGAQFVPENVAQHGSVKEFVVEEGNSKYFSQDGVLYGYDEEGRQILVSYPKAKEDTTYTVLEGTVEIGQDAFRSRESIEEIILPEGLEVIRQDGFVYCKSLKKMELPASVTTIEYDAFYGCSSLMEFTLSENLTKETVDNSILGDCGQLTTLYVPVAAAYVPDSVNVASLQNIIVVDKEGKKNVEGINYSSLDGVLFSADGTALLRMPRNKQVGEYEIPETVTRIEKSAFYQQQHVTAVTIPTGVTYIGYNAFYNSPSLQLIWANGCNPETIEDDALEANGEVVIMCDPGTTVETHAINQGLIYLTGENMITASVLKQLTGSTDSEAALLSEYQVNVYLGDNGTDENYKFPAYTAGDYILLPGGKRAANGEIVGNYDKVTIELISKNGECENSVTVVELDEKKCAEVILATGQRGYVTGQVTAAATNTVSLYDSEGNFLYKPERTAAGYTSEFLPEGEYTLVVLQGRIRNWIQDSLEEYDTLGMQAGVDYVKETVQVKNGQILTKDITMPAESEYASVWLDTAKTSYMVLDNNITTAGLVNFRLSYALKENLAAYELGYKELHITLPEGLQVYWESVMENGKAAEDYNISGDELVVYVTGNSGTVQFSASPTAYGKIESQATFTFSYEGVDYEEYVGDIATSMEYITMAAPATTEIRSIMVYGVSVPGETVTIYDGETIIGTTTALQSGKWSAVVDLSTNDADKLHQVSASVTVDGETIRTSSKEVIWADNLTYIKNCYLYYSGKKYVINEDGTSTPSPITWSPNAGYTFYIQLANDENVESVYITACKEDETAWEYATRNEDGFWVVNTNFEDNGNTIRVISSISWGGGIKGGQGYYEVEWREVDGPPKDIFIGYTMKDQSTTLDPAIIEKYTNLDPQELQEDFEAMPDMWKNATYQMNTNTLDAQGNGTANFDITLDNEFQSVLNYNIETKDRVAMSQADLDKDPNYQKTIGSDGSVMYTRYYYEEVPYGSNVTGVAYGNGLSSYKSSQMSGYMNRGVNGTHNALQISGDANGGYTVQMGSETIYFTPDDVGYAKVILTEIRTEVTNQAIEKFFGKEASQSAGRIAAVVGLYSDAIEVGNNIMSLIAARQAINSSGLSAAEIAARNQALDQLMLGYMICAGLRYAATVVSLGMVFLGAPFMAGLAVAGIMALMNSYVNQTLNDWLSLLLDFDIRWIIDPSGYIYEAVLDNRVEGATATVYYLDEETGEAVEWNATEYNQINPQETGSDGAYAWDVPIGQWKVVVEKEGYESVESEWLPVPPIQTDVNLGLISLEKPAVKEVHLYQDSVVVEFTQYMQVDGMSADAFGLGSAAQIGEVEAMDALPSAADENIMLAKLFKVSYTGTAGDLTVAANVMNYVGNTMEADYSAQKLVMEYEVTGLQGQDTVTVNYEDQMQYALQILPAEAAADAVIHVKASDMYGVEIVSISEADAQGVRVITLKGALPTECTLEIEVAGTTVKKQVQVEVQQVRDGAGTGTGSSSGTGNGGASGDGSGIGTSGDGSSEVADTSGDADGKSFPIVPIAIGGGVVVLAGILAAVLVLRKKKGSKADKKE